MKDQKLPSLKITLLLAVVLLAPYLLKLLYTEPYPAIIMPSGHTKLQVDDSTYCAPTRLIYAVDRNTLEYRVVPSDSFLDPAPVRLLAYWERNEFGLNNETVDSTSIEEVKLYYKVKLNDLGFLADHFKMVGKRQCFDRQSKEKIEEIITKELMYELD